MFSLCSYAYGVQMGGEVSEADSGSALRATLSAKMYQEESND